MIRSGSVFVFDEQESGIRRWTDGKLWSPSRVLGNFLIYRELEGRIPASPRSASDVDSFDQWWTRGDLGAESRGKLSSDRKCQYIFAHQGLIKKTISTLIDGHAHHLICYYSAQDFCCRDNQRFDSALHAEMQSTLIPVDLLIDQRVRKPEAVLSFPFGYSLPSKRSSTAANHDMPEHITRQRRNSSVILASPTSTLSVASMIQSPTDSFQELDLSPNVTFHTPPQVSSDLTYYTADHGDRDILPASDHHLPSPCVSASIPGYLRCPPHGVFPNDPLQFIEDLQHCFDSI